MSPAPPVDRRSALGSLGLGAAAVLGLTAVVGPGRGSMTEVGGGSTRTVSSVAGRSALDESAFRAYAARMADHYGDAGVFGVGAPTYDGFASARVDSFDGVDPDGDAFDGRFDLDAALATYRVASSDGETRYRHLLWIAADGRNLRYVADPFRSLTKPLRPDYLGVGLEAGTGRLENPAVTGATEAARVDVPLGRGGADFPLPTGRVSDRASPVGSAPDLGRGGRYGLSWRGFADGPQSVATVVDTVHPGSGPDVEWSTEFGFGYRSLV